MEKPVELESMSLSSLRHRCSQESEFFFRRQEHDPRFCFELFRRAVIFRDQQAWECLYNQYHRQVTSWIRRHPLFASMEEEIQYYANRVFEKMWASLTPEKFPNFTDLKSILRYLQMCTHSVLVDSARRTKDTLPLEDLVRPGGPPNPGPAVEQQVSSRLMARELWRLIELSLKDGQERRVVYGTFILGLKPDELYETYPRDFESVQSVYRVKEKVLSRLRRDPAIKDFVTNV